MAQEAKAVQLAGFIKARLGPLDDVAQVLAQLGCGFDRRLAFGVDFGSSQSPGGHRYVELARVPADFLHIRALLGRCVVGITGRRTGGGIQQGGRLTVTAGHGVFHRQTAAGVAITGTHGVMRPGWFQSEQTAT